MPGSVLWLLRFPPEAEQFVRKEAEDMDCRMHPLLTSADQKADDGGSAHPAGGSFSERIVFSDVAPKPQHLARLANLVDVYLDTPACNAHTGKEIVSYHNVIVATQCYHSIILCPATNG